jgi:hypothetical protein
MAGPTTLDAGDVVNVTFMGKLFGQRVMNTLHFYCNPTAWVTTDLIGGYNAILDKLQVANKTQDKLLACCTPDYSLDFLRAQVISPARKVYHDRVVGAVGTHTGACTVPNTAAAIELKTLFADKPSHRNLFIPAPPTSGITEGVFTFAYMGVLETLADELLVILTPTGTGEVWPVVYTPSSVVNKTRPLATRVVMPEARVLTRRTVGRGI